MAISCVGASLSRSNGLGVISLHTDGAPRHSDTRPHEDRARMCTEGLGRDMLLDRLQYSKAWPCREKSLPWS